MLLLSSMTLEFCPHYSFGHNRDHYSFDHYLFLKCIDLMASRRFYALPNIEIGYMQSLLIQNTFANTMKGVTLILVTDAFCINAYSVNWFYGLMIIQSPCFSLFVSMVVSLCVWLYGCFFLCLTLWLFLSLSLRFFHSSIVGC